MRSSIPGRPTQPPWLRPITERLPPTIRSLVIVYAVLYGLYVMASPLRPLYSQHLALGPEFANGEFWQPITSLFVHLDPLSFFFDMLGLWFVGAAVERSLGRRRFWLLFFGAGILTNLVVALFMVVFQSFTLFAGCGDAVLGLFVAFGVLFGRTQVRVWGALAMEARTLAGVLVGLSLLSALLQGALLSFVGTVTASLFAYFFCGGRIDDIRALLNRGRRSNMQVLNGGKRDKRWMN